MSPSTKLLQIHDILCKTYGAPFPFFSDAPPIDELIGTLLSHRTKNERTAAAFQKLRERYPSWEEVREADEEELVQTIYGVTFPGQKARRIQHILGLIADYTQGKIHLDFLKTMPPTDARKWLEKMPGVGAKTSAAVLNFSTLRIPALVIDSHHYRVATRLGLIPEKATLPKAQALMTAMLPKDWGAQAYYDHHEALMYHGQKRCFPKKPMCDDCPVKPYCSYYQS